MFWPCYCYSTPKKRFFIVLESFISRKNKHNLKPLELKFKLQDLELPKSFSLEEKQTFVYDQGDLGSCTANAFSAAFRINASYKGKYENFEPSRLFFYYNERKVEGHVDEDAGGDVVDGIHFTQIKGVCREKTWPYDIQKFTNEPPPNAYEEAKNFLVSSYGTIPNDTNRLTNIKKFIFEAN